MKARAVGTFIAKGLVTVGALLAWPLSAQTRNPPLPPLPPGAPPGLNQGWFVRRPAPTNPLANPFVLPPAPSARSDAPPAPLLEQTPASPPSPARIIRPGASQPGAFATIQTADPGALKWDAELKEYTSRPGEMTAPFTFWLTNVSSSEVLIHGVRTSCGCTVAKLPAQPWHIPPGGTGPIDVTVNLAGKGGVISKGVTVESTAGIKMLTVKVTITPAGSGPANAMKDGERLKNMQLALADRQAVFKNQECAKCHADPARGKTIGVQVYAAVCEGCHDSHFRAAMVPDLRNLGHPTDAEHWRHWIRYGRPGSMMPAFAQSEGGPLTPQQVEALVDYMVKAYPSRVARAGQTAASFPLGADAPSVRPPSASKTN